MATQSQAYGKWTIRWQPAKGGGYEGTFIGNGKRGAILRDEDEHGLLVRLKNEAGKLEPLYVGMDGAIARFLEFMPGGFEGERNLAQEREYKVKAHQVLTETLPIERALEATPEDADSIRRAPVWINLLSPYEMMHLKEVMERPEGPAFLRAAARFAMGDYGPAGSAMDQAVIKYGRQSWPKVTYFPFLWSPAEHMFLKPTVTRDFAERIGHPFQHEYQTDTSADVYLSLLDLARTTKAAIAALKPKDFIDVQSFIYVVGGYTEEDRPE